MLFRSTTLAMVSTLVLALGVFLGTRTALLLASKRVSRLARRAFARAESRARREDLYGAQLYFGLGNGRSKSAQALYRTALLHRLYFI